MKMIEYQAPTMGNRLAHRRMIRQMAADVMPKDRSWEIVLFMAVSWSAIAVLFVRWWLCV